MTKRQEYNLDTIQVREFRLLIELKIRDLTRVKHLVIDKSIVDRLISTLENILVSVRVFEDDKALSGVYKETASPFIEDILFSVDFWIDNPTESVYTFKQDVALLEDPILLSFLMSVYKDMKNRTC